jgi:L,D-peptidoglycan transpeptidase YkuD (ErfK/YbiS/YcfS/YnhG family)
MKYFFKPFLLLFFMSSILINSVMGQESKIKLNKALQIVETNAAMFDSVGQLLVVFNGQPESNSASLVAMKKTNKVWKAICEPIDVSIGRNGFAAPEAKREGDGKSPTGFFRLGQLFCYDKIINTKMPFIQTTDEDKWIDDPTSKDYNRHVKGETDAKSYEKLKIHGDAYKYCMVIEYNTNPVVKGWGSAIFLHLGKIPEPSAGCVVLNEINLEWALKWMNPKYKPSIIMGNESVLLNGIKR